MSEPNFEIDYWRDRGWNVPDNFKLSEDESQIDYTFQYLISIPISSPIANKSNALKGELLSNILKNIKKDLEVEEMEGWSYCLTKIKLHLGEIVDGSFYTDPSANRKSNSCQTCKQESPIGFDLCWLCGSLLTKSTNIKSFANAFIEITSSASPNDLAEWQYDEGPSRWAEIEWESVVREYFEDLCEIPVTEFSQVNNGDGDVTVTAEGIQITVRFNPAPMVS